MSRLTTTPIQLLPVALLLCASSASAASEAECCLRGTSTAMSAVHSKGQDADEKFFVVKGAPPNLMILLDTSGSMRDLPVPPSSVTVSGPGTTIKRNDNVCDTTMVEYDGIATAGAFSVTKSYPPPDLGVAPCSSGAADCWNGDSGFPDLFDEGSYFRDGEWDDKSATKRTLSKACEYTNYPAECRACVAEKGYYVNHANRNEAVFTGKFLNFYPPKFVVARTVVKNVIWSIAEVRMGLSRFNSGNTGASLLSGLSPACHKSLDKEDGEWATNRQNLINTLNNTNKVSFSGGTPLAEALLDVGQYFTSDASVFDNWFGKGWTKKEFENKYDSESRSVCFGCQISSVALITDGAPWGDNCIPPEIQAQGADCTGCNQMDGACLGSCTGDTSKGSPNCNTKKNQLDDVAKWFWEHDLQTKDPKNGKWSSEGRQRLATYTVGFGIDHPLLANAAKVGGGQYHTANDRKSLEDALRSIVDSVNQRATSFGVSSISTLQSSAGMSTLVPRFVPGREGEEWRGYLYRFKLGNEITNGCVPTVAPDPAHAMDLNKDRDCKDVFYVDADNDILEEDPMTGQFLKRGTSTLAVPVWEAGERLGLLGPDKRKIYTVVDDSGDNRFDAQDTVIEFSKANATKLMPYLNISADISGDAECQSLMTSFGYNPTAPGPAPSGYSSWGHKCAEGLIEYYRGLRAFDIDPAKRTTARPWLLGDIFHSSPVLVEPPAAEEACFLFPGQCISSLFTYGGKIDNDARAAYRDYVTSPSGPCADSNSCEKRKSIVLVGSNSGFLHAFEGGKNVSVDDDDRDEITGRLKYDVGTGDELWAFIPPDLLGKLKYYTDGRHGYFVDGTPMVRDIWVDGDTVKQGDGKKDAGEYRTVAIVGSRSGGQHYFALDVTRDVASVTGPEFLWMWPQPCDPIARDVGESWSSFFPKPPPIVPVLFDASTTGYPGGFDYEFRRYDSSEKNWSNHKVKAQERWVVALNGGHDRALSRGRGFAIVDAWNGVTYWSEFYDPNGTEMQKRLQYPFAAGVGMLDIGPGEQGAQAFFDGYFDSFTVGDLGGNLWVARMYEPGKLSSSGEVTNWAYARAFQTERDSATDMQHRRPISFITSNTLQPATGYVRTFFGTGDRDMLLDMNGGTCSLDNLQACVAMGCNVSAQYDMVNVPSGARQIKSTWASYDLTEATNKSTSCTGADCGVCETTALTYTAEVSGCPSLKVETASTLRREVQMACKTSSSGKLTCDLTAPSNSTETIVWKQANIPTTMHRFFGLHAFGSGNPQKVFSTPEEAEVFDSKRLSEAELVSLGTLNVPSGEYGKRDGPGWYIDYDSVSERTASPATVTFSQNLESGCVIWNTLTPQSNTTVCAGSGAQIAHLVQADFVTGEANCGVGWNGERYTSRAVIAPPAEPTTVVMLGGAGSGSVSYGVITAEPGNNPEATLTATDVDPVQSIYLLELNPVEHACRHRVGGAACLR